MILDATNIALCKFYPKPPTNRVTINKFSSYTPLAHLKSKCAQINRANNMYEFTLWPSEHIHILSCPQFIPFFSIQWSYPINYFHHIFTVYLLVQSLAAKSLPNPVWKTTMAHMVYQISKGYPPLAT